MQLRVLLSELKRRQVDRAIIVYATIAWVLLEGSDIVFPRLGFADESFTLVLILVCTGFPIALYLAWVFDITPDGIFRTPPLTPGTIHHFSWGRILEFILIGGLIVAVGIAEELLLALSKVEPLSVVARTSSFAFKNTDKTIAEIADILDVKAVLEGSVRRSGELVRVV